MAVKTFGSISPKFVKRIQIIDWIITNGSSVKTISVGIEKPENVILYNTIFSAGSSAKDDGILYKMSGTSVRLERGGTSGDKKGQIIVVEFEKSYIKQTLEMTVTSAGTQLDLTPYEIDNCIICASVKSTYSGNDIGQTQKTIWLDRPNNKFVFEIAGTTVNFKLIEFKKEVS